MSGERRNSTTVLDGNAVKRAAVDAGLDSTDLRLLLCVAAGIASSAADFARATGIDPGDAGAAWGRMVRRGYLTSPPAPEEPERRRPTRRGGQARLHGDLLRRGRVVLSEVPPAHPVVDELNSDRRAMPLGAAMATLLGVDRPASDAQSAPLADRFRLWLRTILSPEDAETLLSAGAEGDEGCRQLAQRFDRATDDTALDRLLEETQATVARVRASTV